MGGSDSKLEVSAAKAVTPSFSDKTTDRQLNNHAQADNNTPILIVLSYKDIANLNAGADTREQQLFEYLFSLIKQYKNADTRDVRILLADTLQKHNGVEEAQLRAWVNHFCEVHEVQCLLNPPEPGPVGALLPEGFASPVGVYLWKHYLPKPVKTFVTHFRAALNGLASENLNNVATLEALQETFHATCKNITFKPGLPDSAIDQLLKDALFQAVSRTALSYPHEISKQIQYDDALQTNIHQLIAKLPESIKTSFQAKLINNLLYILEETLTVITLQNQNYTHIYYAGRIPKHHPTCTLPDFYDENLWDFVSLSSFSQKPDGVLPKRRQPTQIPDSSKMSEARKGNDGLRMLASSAPIDIKSPETVQGGSSNDNSHSSTPGENMLIAQGHEGLVKTSDAPPARETSPRASRNNPHPLIAAAAGHFGAQESIDPFEFAGFLELYAEVNKLRAAARLSTSPPSEHELANSTPGSASSSENGEDGIAETAVRNPVRISVPKTPQTGIAPAAANKAPAHTKRTNKANQP